MISKVLILLTIASVSFSAVWQGYLPEKPKEFAHKEGCYVKEINDVLPFGSTVTPIGHCYRIQCGSTMMHYASCGKVIPGPDCYVTKKDLTKPYPACCPQIKCISHNTVTE